MTIVTLKINERTSVGKAFLTMINAFVSEERSIKVLEKRDETYPPEFVAKIKESQDQFERGEYSTIDLDAFWK